MLKGEKRQLQENAQNGYAQQLESVKKQNQKLEEEVKYRREKIEEKNKEIESLDRLIVSFLGRKEIESSMIYREMQQLENDVENLRFQVVSGLKGGSTSNAYSTNTAGNFNKFDPPSATKEDYRRAMRNDVKNDLNEEYKNSVLQEVIKRETRDEAPPLIKVEHRENSREEVNIFTKNDTKVDLKREVKDEYNIKEITKSVNVTRRVHDISSRNTFQTTTASKERKSPTSASELVKKQQASEYQSYLKQANEIKSLLQSEPTSQYSSIDIPSRPNRVENRYAQFEAKSQRQPPPNDLKKPDDLAKRIQQRLGSANKNIK
jgi:hypothetical protein